ncbi:hypothetical protein KTAU_31720 [Thermogemmatispora aurantia]|nr:hypothetical protein KTAU_31720 [Thermogemmatispora aurantia]
MLLGKHCEEVAFVRRLKDLLIEDSALHGESRSDPCIPGSRAAGTAVETTRRGAGAAARGSLSLRVLPS